MSKFQAVPALVGASEAPWALTFQKTVGQQRVESIANILILDLFLGLTSEGLYRVAGFHDDVEAIKMAFDKGKFYPLSCVSLSNLVITELAVKSDFYLLV
jgi:hypothetical protein